MAPPVRPGILKTKSNAMSSIKSKSKPSKLSKETVEDSSEDDDDGHSSASTSSISSSDSDSDSDASLTTLFPPTVTPTTAKKRKTQHLGPEPNDPTTIFPLPLNSTPLQTTSSSSTSPFAQSNLSGKHLWLITCPPHIPLSSLSGTRVPFSQLTTGEPFLEHKGLRYGLHPNSDNSDGSGVGMNLLVPVSGSTTDGSYAVSTVRVERSFRLTAAPPVLLQNSSENSPQKKQMRTQPEGLRMRYQPFGSGPTLPGGDIFGGDDVDFRELENVNDHVDDNFKPRNKKKRIEKDGEEGKRRKKDKTEQLNGDKRHREKKKKKKKEIAPGTVS